MVVEPQSATIHSDKLHKKYLLGESRMFSLVHDNQ